MECTFLKSFWGTIWQCVKNTKMFSYLTRNCIPPYVAQGIIMDNKVFVAKMVSAVVSQRARTYTKQG